MLPTMAITLAVFAAVQLLMIGGVRPHLIPASTAIEPLSAVTLNGWGDTDKGHLIMNLGTVHARPGAWITGAQPIDAAGQPATTAPAACASITNTFLQCLAGHGIRFRVSYQPASRYWALQWLETGIYLVLATGLGWICVWQVRRKRP
jgi:hypothetical protein